MLSAQIHAIKRFINPSKIILKYTTRYTPQGPHWSGLIPADSIIRHQGVNLITQFCQALQIDLTGEYKTKRPPSTSFLSFVHPLNSLSGIMTNIARLTRTNMPP